MEYVSNKSIKEPLEPKLERITKEDVDAAYKVHSVLGPGLLENVYESCLIHELQKRNLIVEKQVVIPIFYEDLKIENGLKMDIVVEESLIIELKAVETLLPVHRTQLLTYLKLSGFRLGLLLKDGIKRIIL